MEIGGHSSVSLAARAELSPRAESGAKLPVTIANIYLTCVNFAREKSGRFVGKICGRYCGRIFGRRANSRIPPRPSFAESAKGSSIYTSSHTCKDRTTCSETSGKEHREDRGSTNCVGDVSLQEAYFDNSMIWRAFAFGASSAAEMMVTARIICRRRSRIISAIVCCSWRIVSKREGKYSSVTTSIW